MGLTTSFLRKAEEWLLNTYGYAAILILVAFTGSVLNFNGKTMHGLIPAYMRFADLFASGMDLEASSMGTFPMWGYGLILLLTKSKATIIIAQQAFTVGVLLFLDYSLKRFGWSNVARIFLRLLTILSLPWFYFHTILWPYSPGANLLMLSSILILYYIHFGGFRYVLLSALLFGLMLNFRSDYFFLGLAMPIVVAFVHLLRSSKLIWWHYLSWYLAMFLLLVPWGLYSLKKTDTFLTKSSNGGHVLFISLGQLPENKWKITPLDGDSVMRAIVNKEIGKGASTLTHQADTLLTKKWLGLIKKDKWEFVRKCVHNAQSIFDSPFYNGELGSTSEGYADNVMQTSLDQRLQSIADDVSASGSHQSIGLIRRIYEQIGLAMPPGVIIGLLLSAFVVGRELLRNPIFWILLTLVVYQFALMVLGYFMISYHTNLFIAYEVLIVLLFIELRPFQTLLTKWQEMDDQSRKLLSEESPVNPSS